MNVLAVLQARMSSSRLPGKVLRPILGEPMLLRQIERIRRAGQIDHLAVATSMDSSDDELETLCKKNKIDVFRGSLNDVLDRFYQAAKPHQPKIVVRLTGDCPLADPAVIDRIIAVHKKEGNDCTSNSNQPTFPDGLDCEAVSFSVLETAWKEASLTSDREHVTPFIYRNQQRFKVAAVKNDVDLSALRWTVDEPQDFKMVEAVYKELYPSKPNFDMNDVLNLLERRPELKEWNSSFARNEGLAKSLRDDANQRKP